MSPKKILLLSFILFAAFSCHAQKSLTEIDFYQIKSDVYDEMAPRLDTFSYILQYLPKISQEPKPALNSYPLEQRIVFMDTVEQNIVRVEYATVKSDFSKRKVDYQNLMIDGAPAYGHDGFDKSKLTYIMQNYIGELKISVNGKSVPIDPKVYRNFFSAGIINAFRAIDRDLIVIQIGGGDGAGHYEAVLLFNSKGLVGKYMNTGGIFYQPAPDYFSKTKSFEYDILCHYDEWAYFPKHKLTKIRDLKIPVSGGDALNFSKSFDFSPVIASDTVYADYGVAKSPLRSQLLQFFISNVKKSESNPLQYELSGVLKDGQSVFEISGKQFIHQAKFANGARGSLIVHGSFVMDVKNQDNIVRKISGLWTYDIKYLKNVPAIDLDELRNVKWENISKSYSGTMTGTKGKAIELLKWGNATTAGNWFGTPTEAGWWKARR
jgi:hypothetical protein